VVIGVIDNQVVIARHELHQRGVGSGPRARHPEGGAHVVSLESAEYREREAAIRTSIESQGDRARTSPSLRHDGGRGWRTSYEDQEDRQSQFREHPPLNTRRRSRLELKLNLLIGLYCRATTSGGPWLEGEARDTAGRNGTELGDDG
jgi:hypothetical protein